MNVTVLGPQRRTSAARAAVRELMPDGPIATVNAGWQERESGTAELDEVLGGRMVNLGLYGRWQEMITADPEYAAAERRLTELLAERQEIYALRLGHALAAADAVSRRNKMPAVRAEAVADALRTIQELDRWHLTEVGEARGRLLRRRPGSVSAPVSPSSAPSSPSCVDRLLRHGHHRRARRRAAAPAAHLRPGRDDQGSVDHLVGRGDGAVGPGGAVP